MGNVAILGLGASLKLYDPAGFDYSIGVNDIFRYVKCNAVVVLNYPKEFKPDRWQVINECRPEIFYSQIISYDYRKDFKHISLLPGYPDKGLNLTAGIYKSYCSPFVAVQLAYRYHAAKEIHLFGVDLVNHPHLKPALCQSIKNHFSHLFYALSQSGVTWKVHGTGLLTE